MVSLNCATIPEGLAESELFGHVRGAFSGAVSDKVGLLESASGGTVFLDELGELSLQNQAKLLRAIETLRITRVGDTRTREINVRFVAATNRSLEDAVRAGRFRDDLFYRLSVGLITLPPLRERKRELPILARTFLDAARRRSEQPPLTLSDAVTARLLSLKWPGNVRQLKNEMEYLAATVSESIVQLWHLPDRLGGQTVPFSGSEADAPAGDPRVFRPLEEEVRDLERTRIQEALLAAGGVQVRAAKLLGVPERTFYMKVKQYGIPVRELSAKR